MKIIVFGGTFNPPHLGHALMVSQVLSQPIPDVFSRSSSPCIGAMESQPIATSLPTNGSAEANNLPLTFADQVWLVPVGQHYFAKHYVSAQHRLLMLKSFVKDMNQQNPALVDKIHINTYEIDRPVMSHTADTMDFFVKQYPQHQFAFLLGCDNLAQFHLWKDSQERDFHYLLKNHPILVYPRSGAPFQPLYENMIPLRNFPQMNVSSTQLRQEIASGGNFQPFLSPGVLLYITNNQLYIK